MTTARNLTGLVGARRDDVPERTVTPPPSRRRSPERDPVVPNVPLEPQAADHGGDQAIQIRRPRRQPAGKKRASDEQAELQTTRPTTVRVSVNIPLACKQWLAIQAREQKRFVSEIVMQAVDCYGEGASPPADRAKRVVVPDGTICNIVLPIDDRQRVDDIVARKNTTRSALLTEVLAAASGTVSEVVRDAVRHGLRTD